jgi:CheY-like chemotaxis protein
MMTERSLRGLRLLVVEDEVLVALMIEDMLAELGCVIAGMVASVPKALDIARSAPLEGAVLDINVAGEAIYPVAQILMERGVPFLFTTGYDPSGIDRRFAHAPVVRKPFQVSELKLGLTKLRPA